jgi:hypothetical protein
MGRLPMMIKASGRSALILVTGLFVCFAGVSYTTAATEAATSKTETATATKSAKQGTRHWKRYAHRKYSRTALKSSSSSKTAENEVADVSGDVPVTIPPLVANANAQLADAPSDSAGPMTARANAILMAAADKPAEAQAPADNQTNQVVAPDQLNDVDRTLQEAAPPSQTVAMAANSAVKAVASAPASAGNDNSTWDETSLIGKIFIAFGALLTVASAVRMFMA